MWNAELGKGKPRGILDHELGPTSLPGTYYTYSHKRPSGAGQPAAETPAWPAGQQMFVRNNPHPHRVRHFKGLCDAPICMVRDARTEGHRVMLSAPSGDQRLLRQLAERPAVASTRYGANAAKMTPALGIVPVTFAWKDDLEKMATDIVDKAAASQNASSDCPMKMMYGKMDEAKILDVLCRILQTESIPAVQDWLRHASENEKTIVLNMIHMAATGELSCGGTAASTAKSSRTSKTYFYERPGNSYENNRRSLTTDPLDGIPLSPSVKLASGRPRTRHTLPMATPTGALRLKPGTVNTPSATAWSRQNGPSAQASGPRFAMDPENVALLSAQPSARKPRTRQRITDAPREPQDIPLSRQVAGGRLMISSGGEKRWALPAGRKKADKAKADAHQDGRIAFPEFWTPGQ